MFNTIEVTDHFGITLEVGEKISLLTKWQVNDLTKNYVNRQFGFLNMVRGGTYKVKALDVREDNTQWVCIKHNKKRVWLPSDIVQFVF